MKYYEAPQQIDFKDFDNSIFLGGSITGAVDWQKEAAEKLLPYFNVINPRRANYSTLDPKTEEEQITWEYYAMLCVDNILFWFSNETLAPITLFEYGKLLGRKINGQRLFIGIHPEYQRKNDVIIQTKLENKELYLNINFSQIGRASCRERV